MALSGVFRLPYPLSPVPVPWIYRGLHSQTPFIYHTVPIDLIKILAMPLTLIQYYDASVTHYLNFVFYKAYVVYMYIITQKRRFDVK